MNEVKEHAQVMQPQVVESEFEYGRMMPGPQVSNHDFTPHIGADNYIGIIRLNSHMVQA